MGTTPARLGDLRRRGKLHTFKDPGGEDSEHGPIEVTVYVRKLRQFEVEKVQGAAEAERAKTLARYRDPEGDDRQVVVQRVWDLVDKATLDPSDEESKKLPIVALLATYEVGEKAKAIEAEHEGADGSEWAKDGYLQSLREAWLGDADREGLKFVYAIVGDKPIEEWSEDALAGDFTEEIVADARRVFDEFKRFNDEVDQLLQDEMTEARDSLEGLAFEALFDRAVAKMVEEEGQIAWMRGLRYGELLHAVRDAKDHGARYFRDLNEIVELDPDIRAELMAVIGSMEIGTDEGKDSPLTPASSQRSSLPDAGVASDPSSTSSAA